MQEDDDKAGDLVIRIGCLAIGAGSGLFAFSEIRSVWGYPISLIPMATWIFGGGSFLLATLLIQRGLTKKHQPKNSPVDTRKCAYCAEDIKIEAKICKHCGKEVASTIEAT